MAERHDPTSTVATDHRSLIARRRHDWSSDPPSSAVVEAVATVANADPTELEPLTEAVDPDALDGMLATGTTGDGRELRISFRYGGYAVSASPDGTIEIRSSDGRS